LLNLILRLVRDKRPPVPVNDPTDYKEKVASRRMLVDAIEYVETGEEGRASLSEEKKAKIGN
jgi:hypothetical protein